MTDIDWTDKDGQKHSAQLKFSSKKYPKVSSKEYDNLGEYAIKHKDTKIWLVCKLSRKPELWQKIL